mgnify:CR=1 FL=1
MGKVVSGRTAPGAGWKNYPPPSGEAGISIQVDTTSAGFTSTPTYVTSLGGNAEHWNTTGGSSVYPPDHGDLKRGFKIYVRWANGAELEPEKATQRGWYINWIGME